MMGIAEIWGLIPVLLQRAIAIAIGASLFVAMLTLAWALWGSGYVQEKLGIPVTVEDLHQQTQEIQQDQWHLVHMVVDTAIEAYDARLQRYLYAREEEARRTILEPMLMGMEALERNQQDLMRSQSRTTDQMEAMPKVFDRKLDRLIEETAREDERRKERELLEELLRRAQEREAVEEEPTKKSKIRL